MSDTPELQFRPEDILAVARQAIAEGPIEGRVPPLWDGHAAERILDIVARDVKSSNIVYGTRGAGPACFLIDGYGERNLIPLRSLSQRLNDRSLNKQFSLIAQKAGLAWNADKRTFSNS